MRFLSKLFIVMALLSFMQLSYAAKNSSRPIAQPVSPEQLDGYQALSSEIKELLTVAQKLSQKRLTYLFGSANPKNGGMDCSGTINYLLNASNVNNAPRDATGLYLWTSKKGKFHSVQSKKLESVEFSHLKPGDLLFWTGTYKTKRNPPISHVMLYLGKNKQGQPLMFGAGNGHTYQGKRMRGVGIFDFTLPDPRSPAKFIGYGCIPEVTCGAG